MISGDFNINEVNNSSNSAPVTPTKRAMERIEALRRAGVDTSNYYAINNDMVIRVDDGKPNLVSDDDPVWRAISESGMVPDRRLFRRWVLAQTFYMLRNDYTAEMKRKGYEYTWRMTEEEFRVQSKLYGHDNENFALRNRFFNKDVVVAMAHDYMKQLRDYIDGLKTRRCKGVPYKHFRGRNVFVADLDSKVYNPLDRLIMRIEDALSPCTLYIAVRKFNSQRVPLHWGEKQSAAWVDAYKGAGAYFSMQNLIRFHGMVLRKPNSRSYTTVSGEKAIAFLNECADKKHGWELLGMLKEALDYNHIDIAQKMQQWHK